MVRILSLDENEIINKDFFEKRISYALEHRKTLGWDATRLIFSEADFCLGLSLINMVIIYLFNLCHLVWI